MPVKNNSHWAKFILLSPTLFQRNMKSLKISLMDTPQVQVSVVPRMRQHRGALHYLRTENKKS